MESLGGYSRSVSGVGAFGFGDRGVNSDEPCRARKKRRKKKRGPGEREGKEDEEKDEK